MNLFYLFQSTKDLSGFSVMFFIIYFAFVQLGFLLFGIQVYDFRSFIDSVFTLFRMILGDFNFKAIENANVILGPAYFLLYIFFVFFVLLVSVLFAKVVDEWHLLIITYLNSEHVSGYHQ